MASNRKTNRIFLVSQEDINSKVCSKTVKFRDTDKIFVLTEEEPLKLPEGLLDYFGNKEQPLSLNGEELVEHLRSIRENDKEIYYFIGSRIKELYREIGNDVMLFSKGIAYNDTFGISKVPIEKPTQSEFMDLESSFNAVSESLSLTLEESLIDNVNNEPKTQEEDSKKKKFDLKKNAGSDGKQQEFEKKQDSKDDSEQISFKKTKKKDTSETKNTKNENKKVVPEQENKDSSKNIVLEEPVRLEMHMEEEKKIPVSEHCVLSKAAVIFWLLKRFQEHVAIFTKRDMEQEVCFQFLQLLLKAKDPDDFTMSWKCQDPDSRIVLSMDQFLDLKKEALYWYDVSNLFYKGDLWNY